MTAQPRKRSARRSLGFTETVAIKLHPDLKDWLDDEASRRYMTVQDVIRQLIVTAKLASEQTE
jgi:hypothetical protein